MWIYCLYFSFVLRFVFKVYFHICAHRSLYPDIFSSFLTAFDSTSQAPHVNALIPAYCDRSTEVVNVLYLPAPSSPTCSAAASPTAGLGTVISGGAEWTDRVYAVLPSRTTAATASSASASAGSKRGAAAAASAPRGVVTVSLGDGGQVELDVHALWVHHQTAVSAGQCETLPTVLAEGTEVKPPVGCTVESERKFVHANFAVMDSFYNADMHLAWSFETVTLACAPCAPAAPAAAAVPVSAPAAAPAASTAAAETGDVVCGPNAAVVSAVEHSLLAVVYTQPPAARVALGLVFTLLAHCSITPELTATGGLSGRALLQAATLLLATAIGAVIAVDALRTPPKPCKAPASVSNKPVAAAAKAPVAAAAVASAALSTPAAATAAARVSEPVTVHLLTLIPVRLSDRHSPSGPTLLNGAPLDAREWPPLPRTTVFCTAAAGATVGASAGARRAAYASSLAGSGGAAANGAAGGDDEPVSIQLQYLQQQQRQQMMLQQAMGVRSVVPLAPATASSPRAGLLSASGGAGGSHAALGGLSGLGVAVPGGGSAGDATARPVARGASADRNDAFSDNDESGDEDTGSDLELTGGAAAGAGTGAGARSGHTRSSRGSTDASAATAHSAAAAAATAAAAADGSIPSAAAANAAAAAATAPAVVREDPNCGNVYFAPWGAWCQSDYRPLVLRGPDYLTNKKKPKVPATPFRFESCHCEIVAVRKMRAHDAARRNSYFNQQLNMIKEHGREAEWALGTPLKFMLVNFMVPGSPQYNFVMYFRNPYISPSPYPEHAHGLAPGSFTPTVNYPEGDPFFDLMDRFVNGTDEFRTSRFKYIPNVAVGSWIVKRGVGQTPVILGNKLKQRYYQDANKQYMEIDVDVSSSSVAGSVLKLVKGYAKTLEIDLNFLLEPHANDELPEALWGGVRICNVDLLNIKISEDEIEENDQ